MSEKFRVLDGEVDLEREDVRDSQNRRIDADHVERAVADVHARRGRGLQNQDALAPVSDAGHQGGGPVQRAAGPGRECAGSWYLPGRERANVNPLRAIRPRCGRRAGRVEVAFLRGQRLVRDSKLGDTSPVLAISPTEWNAFTAAVKAGYLDG